MDPRQETIPAPAFDEVEYGRALESLSLDLRGYIRSLLIDKDSADDVLQEVCLFLWDRRDEFHGDALRPSAFRVAWFKVLAHRRDRQRERVVHFSDDALQRIAGAAETISDQAGPKLIALRVCLANLSPEQLELLNLKYVKGVSLTQYANLNQQSPNSVQKAISRIRLALRRCIESKLSE